MLKIKVDEDFTLNVVEEVEEKPNLKVEILDETPLEKDQIITVGFGPVQTTKEEPKECETNLSQELNCIINSSIEIKTSSQESTSSCPSQGSQTTSENSIKTEPNTSDNNLVGNIDIQIEENNDKYEIKTDRNRNELVTEKIKQEDVIDLTDSEDYVITSLSSPAQVSTVNRNSRCSSDNERNTVIIFNNQKSVINSSDNSLSLKQYQQNTNTSHEISDNSLSSVWKETPIFLKVRSDLQKESNFGVHSNNQECNTNLNNTVLTNSTTGEHVRSGISVPLDLEATKRRLSSENPKDPKETQNNVPQIISIPKPDITKLFLYTTTRPPEVHKTQEQNTNIQTSATHKENPTKSLSDLDKSLEKNKEKLCLKSTKNQHLKSCKETNKAQKFVRQKNLKDAQSFMKGKNDLSKNSFRGPGRPAKKNEVPTTTGGTADLDVKKIIAQNSSGDQFVLNGPLKGLKCPNQLPKSTKTSVGKPKIQKSLQSESAVDSGAKSKEFPKNIADGRKKYSTSSETGSVSSSNKASAQSSEPSQADNNERIVKLLKRLLREENNEEKRKIGKTLKHLLDEDGADGEETITSSLSSAISGETNPKEKSDNSRESNSSLKKVGDVSKSKKNDHSVQTTGPCIPQNTEIQARPFFVNNDVTVPAIPSNKNGLELGPQDLRLRKIPVPSPKLTLSKEQNLPGIECQKHSGKKVPTLAASRKIDKQASVSRVPDNLEAREALKLTSINSAKNKIIELAAPKISSNFTEGDKRVMHCIVGGQNPPENNPSKTVSNSTVTASDNFKATSLNIESRRSAEFSNVNLEASKMNALYTARTGPTSTVYNNPSASNPCGSSNLQSVRPSGYPSISRLQDKSSNVSSNLQRIHPSGFPLISRPQDKSSSLQNVQKRQQNRKNSEKQKKSGSWRGIRPNTPVSRLSSKSGVLSVQVPQSNGVMRGGDPNGSSLAEIIVQNSPVYQRRDHDQNCGGGETRNNRQFPNTSNFNNSNDYTARNNQKQLARVSTSQRATSDFYVRSGQNQAGKSTEASNGRKNLKQPPTRKTSCFAGNKKKTVNQHDTPKKRVRKISQWNPNPNLSEQNPVPRMCVNNRQIPSEPSDLPTKTKKRRYIFEHSNFSSPTKARRSSECQARNPNSEWNSIGFVPPRPKAPPVNFMVQQYLTEVMTPPVFDPPPAPVLGHCHPYNIYISQFDQSKPQNGRR